MDRLTRLLSAGSLLAIAVAYSIPLTEKSPVCGGDLAPNRLRWLTPDDPSDDLPLAPFFHVNQDVDVVDCCS
jgi:hypothetical protein